MATRGQAVPSVKKTYFLARGFRTTKEAGIQFGIRLSGTARKSGGYLVVSKLDGTWVSETVRKLEGIREVKRFRKCKASYFRRTGAEEVCSKRC